ncbi:hypothetical protein [Mucilaginibacter gotjawali]|uniref:Uncharacterized protein n=2 Tax=Mucilaginibacter gotjawali TaxID=1550579 RepID=A0A839SHB9_9SPHI|nr:hypothetical protein [Mucilaginibacter gotjawali]MBB3057701.1 hypothetical protein [Mucilaginibacter gotjawali]BAU52504.1 hypothetical protein MgSA37_00665 [Mucilaginibacter gotjawali]
MKKTFTLILAVAVIFISSCKKDSKNNPASSSTNNDYFPLTSNSAWKYLVTGAGGSDTLTVKLTGSATVIDGKTYYNTNSMYQKMGTSVGYFFRQNHLYGSNSSNATAGLTIEFEFLNDTAAAGHSWISLPTVNGLVNSVPARTVNTIREVNISKTVGGKIFTNVIHAEVDLQYNYGRGYESSAVYEFYFAKGVGMIENSTFISGNMYETESIISYDISAVLI